MARICLRLVGSLGMSVIEMESRLTETEILDYWSAFCENAGVQVKTNEELAIEAGLTEDDIEFVQNRAWGEMNQLMTDKWEKLNGNSN